MNQDTPVSPRVFDKLFADILPLIDEEARKLQDDAKNYKLSFRPFTLNLLYGIIMGIKSISLLVTHIRTSSHTAALGLVKTSKSMYSEAFDRYAVSIYRRIFYNLLERLNFLEIPELKALGVFHLVDGSVFPAICSMVWASYKKNVKAIKLHLAFDLNRMIPSQFISTPANTSEKQTLLKMLEAGITYICDRGYVCFKLFHKICKAEADFIIRGKSNHVYQVIEELVVEIPETWAAFVQDVSDVKVTFTNDSYNGIYRLVSFTILETSFVLITSRFDLTTAQVILLYAYRCQVELVFRFLKRTLNGIHLMSLSPWGIEIQFTLFMIAYLLLLAFKQDCQQTAEPEPLNQRHESQTSEAVEQSDEPQSESVDKKSSDILGSTVIHDAYEFMTLLGERLEKYWKIGIHCLTAIRNLLLAPFTPKILKLILLQ